MKFCRCVRPFLTAVALSLVAISIADSTSLSAADSETSSDDSSAISKPVLVEGRRIWDQAKHNAFTDLLRHKNRWYCVFREGSAHVSPDGALRVIVSDDGENVETQGAHHVAEVRPSRCKVNGDAGWPTDAERSRDDRRRQNSVLLDGLVLVGRRTDVDRRQADR